MAGKIEHVLILIVSMTGLRLSFCDDRPNIVFVLADDYGWNDVGYHGSEIETPTLDQLSAEGVRLENYYVQPICTPSRSQFLSGKYQIHTGLQHGVLISSQRNGLPLDTPTLADKLVDNGYATHLIGKWHLGFYMKEYTPLYRGFQTFFGFYTGQEDHYSHISCGMLNGTNPCGLDFHDNDEPSWAYDGLYSTNAFIQRAQDIITDHDRSKPMFMYLALQAVHTPLQVPQEYIDRYAHIDDTHRRIYAGMVTHMDDAMKNLTRTLQEQGLWNNTIFIFSTDNGGVNPGNNWPLRGSKGSLFEGGVRGVGFVNSQLLRIPGRVSRDLIHISDWFPTILRLANGNSNGLQLDGHDVWETLSYGMPSPRTELLHNIDPLAQKKGSPYMEGTFDSSTSAAIRVGRWKLLTGNPGNDEWMPPPHLSDAKHHIEEDQDKNVWLFDVTADPEELFDLSAYYPDVVLSLLDKLAAYNATAVPARYPPLDPQADPTLRGNVWLPWVES